MGEKKRHLDITEAGPTNKGSVTHLGNLGRLATCSGRAGQRADSQDKAYLPASNCSYFESFLLYTHGFPSRMNDISVS
jgi:hypothetical protein